MINDEEYVHCPVCGTLTAVYDICDHCNWQNTGETNIDGGPNKMTLAEAKQAYAKGEPIKQKHLTGFEVRCFSYTQKGNFDEQIQKIDRID